MKVEDKYRNRAISTCDFSLTGPSSNCPIDTQQYIMYILEIMINWITYIGIDLKLLIYPSIFSWCNVHCHFLFLICRIHFSTLVVYCPSFCKTANVCANSLHMHGFLWVEVSTKLQGSLQNKSVKSWYIFTNYAHEK